MAARFTQQVTGPFRISKNKRVQAWGDAQLVKSLPHKYEDRSWDPRDPHKSWVHWSWFSNPNSGQGDGEGSQNQADPQSALTVQLSQ